MYTSYISHVEATCYEKRMVLAELVYRYLYQTFTPRFTKARGLSTHKNQSKRIQIKASRMKLVPRGRQEREETSVSRNLLNLHIKLYYMY